MQSPAPASSLAEPPPAASLQLGRWTCQQGLQFARIRRQLLLLVAASAAASAAASTTAALAFLRLVTFRFGMTYCYYYCYGFSRHGIRVTLYALIRVARGTAW